jgi:hypothetical protein
MLENFFKELLEELQGSQEGRSKHEDRMARTEKNPMLLASY